MGFSIKETRLWRHFNSRLSGAVALIALSTFNYGFDNQGIATSQAMSSYKSQFGHWDSKTQAWVVPTYWTSLLNSLNFIGFAVGLYIGSVISARFGRRKAMFCMSIWALMSATVLITSTKIEQVLAGRILNYAYIGMELSTCPPYQAEIIPAPVRGFAVGTYQTSLLLGGIVINSICRGTSELPTNAAWRIPQGFFYIVPSIVATCVWFIPESPRWLLIKNRPEGARESLRQLRGDLSEDEIDKELELLRNSLSEEQNHGEYRDLFRGQNLKRTGIAIGMNFFIQSTGSPFTAAYGTLFVQSVGAINPFNYAIMSSCINAFSCLLAILITDRIGRRPLLFIGSTLQVIWLLTMGGVGTAPVLSLAHKQVIIAATALSSASLCFTWNPLNYIISTEVPASRLRDKTQRVASAVNILTNFIWSFSTPYLLNAPYANLQSKVGFIFGGFALCSFFFAFFCVPEMKDRSLEQINEMFESGVPIRGFRNYKFLDSVDDVSESVDPADRATAEIDMNKA